MKKLRRILIFISVAVLLSISICAVDIRINSSGQALKRGDTVTFEAVLDEGVTVGSGSISLSYDSNALKPIGGEWNISNATIAHFDMSKCLGAFAYLSTGDIDGNIFSATFQVTDTAPAGISAVALNISLKDGENLPISVTGGSGNITVLCDHKFTRADMGQAYLKATASCTERAVT